MHPHHYARWKMEPIEFIAINNLPWWLANVIKYTMRFDAKDGLKDLYKARSYLEMKIREVEGEEKFWNKPVDQERKLAGMYVTLEGERPVFHPTTPLSCRGEPLPKCGEFPG
jgi:hypothetical protein